MHALGTSETGIGKDVAGKPGEGLSQLLARILDQLSLSSWLPSIALVAAALLYGNLAVNDAILGRTIKSMAGLRAGQIFLLLLAVVVTTVVTQAFEFEAIRWLEGYWTSARPLVRLRASLTGVHAARVRRLSDRRQRMRV